MTLRMYFKPKTSKVGMQLKNFALWLINDLRLNFTTSK